MRALVYGLWVLWLGCQSASLTAAKIYLREGEADKARQKLEEALVREPQNPEVHYLLGKVAAAAGDYQTMASAFEASLGLGPDFQSQIQQQRRHYWATEYNQGVAFATADPANLAAARQSFRKALTIDSGPLETWRNLAFVYYHLDSLEVAIEAYEHILAESPADSAALAHLGVLYLGQERYAEAVEALTSRLENGPASVDAYLNLGVAYEQLERAEDAEKAYREAILLEPQSAAGHYNLGNLYWHRRAYQKAIVAYKKAVELSPGDNNSLYNLAVCYLSTEDFDRALPLLEDLSERMPDSPLIWRALGRVYAHKGRVEESKRAYEEADLLGP